MALLEQVSDDLTISVNLSEEHLAVGGRSVSASMLADIEELLSIGNPSAELVSDSVMAAIQRILSSDVCISPHVLTWKDGWRLTSAAAHAVVECSSLGRSMFEELEKTGCFHAIYAKPHLVHIMARLLAIYCLSTKGAGNLSELPLVAAHKVFDFFRDDDDYRFSPIQWGSNDYIFQCLKALALGLSRYYGDVRFATRATQRKMTSGGRLTLIGELANFDGDWLPLRSIIRDYISESDTSEYIVVRTARELRKWLTAEFPNKTPAEVLTGKAPKTTFTTHLRRPKERISETDIRLLKCAHEFSDYLIEELGVSKASVRWQLVSKNEIKSAQNVVKKESPRPDKTRNVFPALPVRFLPTLNEVLDEGPTGWPGLSKLFHVDVFHEGRWENIYCPVIVKLYRVRTRLPFRTAGSKRLDSGEGDLKRYDPESGWFIPNDSPHAGYWVRNVPGKEGRAPRGYAVGFQGVKSKFVGINLNSNKTGSVRPIMFEERETLNDLAEVDSWVRKYVPIDGPIESKDYVDNEKRLRGSTLELLPKIFPLFRLPIYARGVRGVAPPTASRLASAWVSIMLEVERRWNLANPTQQVSLVYRDDRGNPTSAVYVPHSLRSRGITDYAEIYGIEFVSEHIAQHASIGMTNGYIDHNPESINRFFQKGQIENQTRAQQATIAAAQSWRIEDAKKYSSHIVEDGLRETMLPAHKQCLLNVGIGVCPMDGNGCAQGGRRREDGGYDVVLGGSRNCVLCRFFWSGPAWLNELALFEESLQVKIEDNTNDQKALLAEVNSIKGGKFAVLATDATVSALTDMRQAHLIKLQDEAAILDQTRIATSIHINSSRRIIDEA